jgi:hypothetical protein
MADDPTMLGEVEKIASELRELDFQFADWSRAQAARIRDLQTRTAHVLGRLRAAKREEPKT